MARGRMINQSISEDVEFNEMSIEAQLMFLRTVPFLDRDGLINGNASVLRGRVAPLLDLPKSMASIVQEWVSAGLVMHYTAGKQSILFFPGFAKNQIGMRYDREAASTYPPPPGYTRTSRGLIAPGEERPQSAQSEDSDNGENGAQPEDELTPDECRTNAGTVPDELHANGIEENRKENESKAAVTFPSSLPSSSTGDPLMDVAKNKFNRGARSSVSWQAEMNLRLEPAKRVPLVNAVGKACGLTAMMNGRDEILCQVHDTACWFYEQGFTTAEKIEALHKVYLTDEWRRKNHPRPSIEAFMKFASSQLDELPTVPTTNGTVTVDWSNYGGGPLKYMEE